MNCRRKEGLDGFQAWPKGHVTQRRHKNGVVGVRKNQIEELIKSNCRRFVLKTHYMPSAVFLS